MQKIRNWFRRERAEMRLLMRSVPATVVTLFVVSVVCMNLLANKTLVQLDWIALDGGILISWLSFMCMDIITKHFGPARVEPRVRARGDDQSAHLPDLLCGERHSLERGRLHGVQQHTRRHMVHPAGQHGGVSRLGGDQQPAELDDRARLSKESERAARLRGALLRLHLHRPVHGQSDLFGHRVHGLCARVLGRLPLDVPAVRDVRADGRGGGAFDGGRVLAHRLSHHARWRAEQVGREYLSISKGERA